MQRAMIDHLKLLRGGEPAEMLVFRKRSPACGYLWRIGARHRLVSAGKRVTTITRSKYCRCTYSTQMHSLGDVRWTILVPRVCACFSSRAHARQIFVVDESATRSRADTQMTSCLPWRAPRCHPTALTASLVWCAAGILDKYRSAASSAAKAPLVASPSGGFCFVPLPFRWRWLRTHSRASKSATSLSYATL